MSGEDEPDEADEAVEPLDGHDDGHQLALIAYLAGELPPDRQDEIDEHLIGCDRCWREVRLVRTGQALARGAVETAPEELRARLGAGFAAADAGGGRWAVARSQRDRFTHRGLTLAGALALAAAAFFTGLGVAHQPVVPVVGAPTGGVRWSV